jgi:hypothetical protein
MTPIPARGTGQRSDDSKGETRVYLGKSSPDNLETVIARPDSAPTQRSDNVIYWVAAVLTTEIRQDTNKRGERCR